MLFVWPWICPLFEKERGKQVACLSNLEMPLPSWLVFVSFTGLVEVLAKGNAVPKAALGSCRNRCLGERAVTSRGGPIWGEEPVC